MADTLRSSIDQMCVSIDIADDGRDNTGTPVGSSGGRGRSNMQARTQRLGGPIEIELGASGTRVSLRVPLAGIGGVAKETT